MRKITIIVALLATTTLTFGQLKDKLKGSKIVTIEQKKTDSFDAIDVNDDVEISLIKGDKSGVEIEADDNLHEALGLQQVGNTLVISMAKEISSYKKFNIRVTYTGTFKSVVTRNKSKVNALEEIKLDNIDFKCLENSKLFLNVNSKVFSVTADDKSYVEMNAKGESATIIMSKNAELKALISAADLKCDMYQKTVANIEGDAIEMKLRLDNNSKFNGKKMTAKKVTLSAEGYSICNVFAETAIAIEASGSTEVQLYGTPKVELNKFADSAILKKVVLK